jgi:acyl-ACP thioesterase
VTTGFRGTAAVARRPPVTCGGTDPRPGSGDRPGRRRDAPQCGMTPRVYVGHRPVRLADTTVEGRLRLDALTRYLSDVAQDDVDDAGYREPVAWLVRRTALTIARFPSLAERLRLATRCSGAGPRWAERTTDVTSASDPGDLAISAVSLWIAVDPTSGRPARLGAEFDRLYGQAAGGARPSTRLGHPPPDPGLATRPWPLRSTDFDLFGHVNNAIHWSAVEDELAMVGGAPPRRAEMEYHHPVLPGGGLEVGRRSRDDLLEVWLLQGGRRAASARLWAPARG